MSETTNTALTLHTPGPDMDLMWDPAGFEHAQRLAKMYASSVLVPDHLRGKVPDVTIALLMAHRLKEDALIVMQNIVVIHGRAGWSAQYIIARANRSGVFRSRINWRSEGKGDSLAVTAFATLATGEEVQFTVPMQMARDEGWTKNGKYKSMPELMLRYRSATFLVRLYAPEIMLGIPTSDEIEDVGTSISADFQTVDAADRKRPTGKKSLGLQDSPPTPDFETELERLEQREPIPSEAPADNHADQAPY